LTILITAYDYQSITGTDSEYHYDYDIESHSDSLFPGRKKE